MASALVEGDVVIAVVCPVLGRPHKAQPLADSLAVATTVPHRLVFVVSPDDPASYHACHQTGADLLLATWTAGPGDFARKVNLAFARSDEPWLFQAADDVEFEPGWDVEALRAAGETGAGVVGTNDDANPLVKRGGHATHSLIRRAYVAEHGATIDGPRLVFSEAYGHMFVDNELRELAVARGAWAFAERSVVRHRHPVFDRSVPRDATYAKGDASHRADARLFRERRRLWQHVAHVAPYVVDSAALAK